MNLVMDVPPKNQVGTDPEGGGAEMGDLYRPKEIEGVRIKRDPEQYMLNPAVKKTFVVEPTLEQDAVLKLEPEEVEVNQTWIRVLNKRRLRAAKNAADPKKDGTREDYLDGEDDDK